IVGPGSIGGTVAWQLARAGHPLVLCARRRFERLVVEDAGGAHPVEAALVDDPRQLAPADWVLLATKAHQTQDAARWLEAGCGPRTRAVVVLQNGVEHEERVRPLVGETPI